MNTIALLGDSTIDNGAYTNGGDDVAAHLSAMLPGNDGVIRLAFDGAITRDIDAQLTRVSPYVTHVVISVGGNDALGSMDLLADGDATGAGSMGEALDLLTERAGSFERGYRVAVENARALQRPTICCTIYDGDLAADQRGRARTALMVFNDAIVRIALEYGQTIVDLRRACCRPEHYYNPIEPSDLGGKRIALAIYRAIYKGSI